MHDAPNAIRHCRARVHSLAKCACLQFYQPGGQNNDVFSIGLVIALLYLAFKFFGEIEKFN